MPLGLLSLELLPLNVCESSGSQPVPSTDGKWEAQENESHGSQEWTKVK